MSEVAEREGWVPAFEGQRPPFPPGHLVNVRHGAHVARVFAPLAQELLDGYLDAYPSLAPYPGALAALAKAEARAALLDQYLTEHGMWDADGELRNDAIRHLRGFERDAAAARATLGLTPDGEAKLMAVRAEAAKGAMSAEAIRVRAEVARERRAQREAGQ